MHQRPHCFYQCYCYAAVVVPAVPCQLNLTGPEGYIEAPPHTNSAFYFTTDCNYIVTVYTGYGVEVQVRKSSTSTQDISVAYWISLMLNTFAQHTYVRNGK